jgi:membrane protease YdiL (CAAX protease family)
MTDQQSAPPEAHPPLEASRARDPFLQRLTPVAFAIFSLVTIFMLYQFVAGGLVMVIARGRFTPENIDLVRWATLVSQVLFILLPTVLLIRARFGNVSSFVRLKLPGTRQLATAVVAVFALQQMAQGYMLAQDAIPLPEFVRKVVDLFKEMFEQAYRMLVGAETPAEFLFVVLVVAVVPAVAEEFLFRGLVQRSIERKAGGLRAAVIAGVIFGAYHLNPFGIVPLVGLGIFFGWLVYRSDNLTIAVAAHFFNNFIACTAIYLKMGEDFIALAPGGGATPLVILANVALFALIFLAALYYFASLTRRKE